MSQSTLAVLAHPAFPQAFDRFQLQVERVITETQLGQCSHESVIAHGDTREDSEYFPCGDPADVHDLLSYRPFCMKHFRAEQLRVALEAVNRG